MVAPVEELLKEHWDDTKGIPASWEIPQATSELDAKLQAVAEMIQSYCPPAQQPPEDEKDPSSVEKMLGESLDEKKLGCRSRLGQWFYRELKLDKQLKEEYDALKTHQAQKDFREKFAKAKYNTLKQSRTKKETSFDLSKVDAEYCSFGRIVQREGGDPPAFATSQTYVRNCVKKWQSGGTFHGHPWLKWCPMRSGMVVLHFRETVSSGHQKTWEVSTTETQSLNNVSATGTAHEVSAPGTARKVSATDTAANVPATGAEQDNKRKQKSAQELDPKRLKEDEEKKALNKRFATALTKANSLKATLQKSSQAAADVLQLVATNPDWSWCNSDALLAPLRQAVADVSAYKTSNSFWKAWTVEVNLATYCRKHFELDYVVAEVTKAETGENSLKVLNDRLVKETLTLKRMQASRMQ